MIDEGRLFSLVAMLAVLFFLVERTLPPGSPWRRRSRAAAVAVLALGFAGTLVLIVLWLSSGGMR
jgi:hypothetical protein